MLVRCTHTYDQRNPLARLRNHTAISLHSALGQAALSWKTSTVYSQRQYGFRHGIAHLIGCGETEAAATLLTGFDYVMTRLQVMGTAEARPLAEDVRATAQVGRFRPDSLLSIWEAFLRERVHLLERNQLDDRPEQTLLQLAWEHADASPISLAASMASKTAHSVDTPHDRPRRFQRIPHCICEGHSAAITGLIVLDSNRV